MAAAEHQAGSKQSTIDRTLEKVKRTISGMHSSIELSERRRMAASDDPLNKQNSLRAAVEGARQKLQRAEQRLTEQAHG